MRIVFGCVGFATNPVFLYRGDRGEDPPLPYGTVIDMHDDVRYWQENYMPNRVTEQDVLKEYKFQVEKHGAKMFDVSKEAWINYRFGQEIKR